MPDGGDGNPDYQKKKHMSNDPMSLSLLKKHNINHMTVRPLSKNQNGESEYQMNLSKGDWLQLMTNLPFSLLHNHHNMPLKTDHDTNMAEREKKSRFWRRY